MSDDPKRAAPVPPGPLSRNLPPNPGPDLTRLGSHPTARADLDAGVNVKGKATVTGSSIAGPSINPLATLKRQR